MIGAVIVLLVAISTATMTTVSDDVADIERDARALELFLKDKKDFKKYCPELDWDQPDIEVYKRELKSQLPSGCKK